MLELPVTFQIQDFLVASEYPCRLPRWKPDSESEYLKVFFFFFFFVYHDAANEAVSISPPPPSGLVQLSEPLCLQWPRNVWISQSHISAFPINSHPRTQHIPVVESETWLDGAETKKKKSEARVALTPHQQSHPSPSLLPQAIHIWLNAKAQCPAQANRKRSFFAASRCSLTSVHAVTLCRLGRKVPRIAVPVLFSAGPLAARQGPGTQFQSTARQRCFWVSSQVPACPQPGSQVHRLARSRSSFSPVSPRPSTPSPIQNSLPAQQSSAPSPNQRPSPAQLLIPPDVEHSSSAITFD